MPYVCDVRTGNVNNVIEVNSKLFIEGQEYTAVNLSPVAFSQGPTTYSSGQSGSVGSANLTQLSMPRVYTRGATGNYPGIGSSGLFDTSRISCGQEVHGSFVYSSSNNRYYGAAGGGGQTAGSITLSSFDSSFRILSPGFAAPVSGLWTGSAAGNYSLSGIVFFPSVNNRWIVLGTTSSTVPHTSTGDTKTRISVLTESGSYTAIRIVDYRIASFPYIGTGSFNPDYVFAVFTPWTAYSDGVSSQSTFYGVYRRDTGAEVVAPTSWISYLTTIGANTQSGCFPSNSIIDVPSNQFYFYYPTISASDLIVMIGTVSNMNSTPSLSAATTGYTFTANSTTDEINTTAFDVPNFSRVTVSNSGGALPGGLSANTFYWTIKNQVTQNFSKLATSYQNAIAGISIDITSAGTGTQTVTVWQSLNIADFSYYTVTANSSTDIINTPVNIPSYTRVRFTNSGGSLPSGISAGVDYWTVRQSVSTSKIATSYANAVNNITVDITSDGTGSTTIYVYTLTSSSGDSNGIVTYPAAWSSSVGRCIRGWVFSDAGVNYLSIGVYEPGNGTAVSNASLNLYLYRLENKTTATFIQRLTLGDAGRVRSYITLDSTMERMLVVYDDRIAYYAWNPATNWTLQSAQSIQTQNVGVDSLGRVWVTTSSGDWNINGSLFQSIYVYEPSGSAVNITLEFAQSSYSYTGTPISSSLTVNAYDVTGSRVALSVGLTRTTTNFEFSGGASSTTVTTSTSGNTSVPISVFGTGVLSCRAAPA